MVKDDARDLFAAARFAGERFAGTVPPANGAALCDVDDDRLALFCVALLRSSSCIPQAAGNRDVRP